MAWRWEVDASGERRAVDKDERAREDNMGVDWDEVDSRNFISRLGGMTNHDTDISTDVDWLLDHSKSQTDRGPSWASSSLVDVTPARPSSQSIAY